MTTTTTWQIDANHSAVAFAVKHMMFTTVRGRFQDMKGTIEVDEKNPARSIVNVEIGAASIDTGVADRDGHLRSGDFLDVEKHPLITFRSKRIEGDIHGNFVVAGDLSIRGKSAEVTLDAVFEGTGTDPWGGTRSGIRATTKIDRRDWDLTWNQALETGGILVGNDLRIELEIQAVKQVAVAA